MAEIDVSAFIMQDAVLKIPTDDYAAAVSSATLTPAGSVVTFKGLKKGKGKSFPTDPTWTCDLEYAQDWTAAGESLSRYLYDHRGETIPGVTLEPQSGIGTRWTFDLVITPGAVGGPVDSVATATVSLGIDGEPVPSAITP